MCSWFSRAVLVAGASPPGCSLEWIVPETGYRTIVADPPWPFVWQGGPGGRRANATELGYRTMSIPELCGNGLPAARAGDATLFLWVTQEVLHAGDALRVVRAWGFPERVGEFIWRKPNFGAGAFPRIGHETCLIYKRGKGSLKPDAPRNVHSVQTWKQDYTNNGGKRHSAKPEGFFDRVVEGYEGPYIEVFARRDRLGWDTWGLECLGGVAA